MIEICGPPVSWTKLTSLFIHGSSTPCENHQICSQTKLLTSQFHFSWSALLLLAFSYSLSENMMLLLLSHSCTRSTPCNLERFWLTKQQSQKFCPVSLVDVFENLCCLCLWDCRCILQSESVYYCASFLVVISVLNFLPVEIG